MTRAYIAGFGTAGSLLAGASVLFVVATAVVSYRGWPQIADAGPKPAVVLQGPAQYGVNASVSRASRGRAVPTAVAARTLTAAAPPAAGRPA
ncbi:MAG TPA: hypothetical protein VG186_18600, partial [Solirubrobacteraceae bacterium]|nr:hypothetical protein [Solirubrobacteraceae bacterium]